MAAMSFDKKGCSGCPSSADEKILWLRKNIDTDFEPPHYLTMSMRAEG